MEKEGLLQYVKLANDLETELYLNRKLLSELPNSQEKQRPVEPQKPNYKSVIPPEKPNIQKPSYSGVIGAGICGCISAFGWIGLEIYFRSRFGEGAGLGPFSLGLGGVLLIVAARAGYKKNKESAESNNQEMRRYEKRLDEFNANLAIWESENNNKKAHYEEEIENFSLELCTYNQNCENEKKLMEKAGIELTDTLNQLYSMDVVFPKYRNIVAISAIYEYLSSGRCSQLEGADGAYNLYEMELRQNIVIGQLSQIISNLEQIKNSQFTLYNEIATADNKAKEILSDINDNVRVNAYCAQASAKSAETLKHLAFIKH